MSGRMSRHLVRDRADHNDRSGRFPIIATRAHEAVSSPGNGVRPAAWGTIGSRTVDVSRTIAVAFA